MRESELEDAGLGDVLAEVVESAKELSRVEIALARQELERDVASFRRSAVIGGIAFMISSIGIGLLLASIAMYFGSALLAACMGAAASSTGMALALWARRSIPTDVLERTRIRAAHNLRTVSEEL